MCIIQEITYMHAVYSQAVGDNYICSRPVLTITFEWIPILIGRPMTMQVVDHTQLKEQ